MDYLCNRLLVDIYMVKAVNSVHRLSNAKMVGHNLYVYTNGMRRESQKYFAEPMQIGCIRLLYPDI